MKNNKTLKNYLIVISIWNLKFITKTTNMNPLLTRAVSCFPWETPWEFEVVGLSSKSKFDQTQHAHTTLGCGSLQAKRSVYCSIILVNTAYNNAKIIHKLQDKPCVHTAKFAKKTKAN